MTVCRAKVAYMFGKTAGVGSSAERRGIMGKREFVNCGDGECQFGKRCLNHMGEYCYVCMFNTGSTPRDYFQAIDKEDEMDSEERDMIEN